MRVERAGDCLAGKHAIVSWIRTSHHEFVSALFDDLNVEYPIPGQSFAVGNLSLGSTTVICIWAI